MTLADQHPTEHLKDNITNNYVNVGVVASLMLSMVSVAPESIGHYLVDATNGGVTFETCENVYTILHALALACLFFSVVTSLQFYVLLSECSSLSQVVVWMTAMRKYLNVHYNLMLIGMCFHLAGITWLVLTILPVGLFVLVFVCACVIMLVSVALQVRGVNSLLLAHRTAS